MKLSSTAIQPVHSSMQHSSNSAVRSIYTSIILGSRRCLSTNTLTTVKREGTVEHITLSNPKTRNALSLEMMKQLTEDIARAGEDKSVRTIVLRGEGKVSILTLRAITDHGAGVLCWAQPEGDDGGHWVWLPHGDIQHLWEDDATYRKGEYSTS